MDKQQVQKLLDLVSTVVSGNGTWKEKRDAVLADATDEEKSNLEEFSYWFALPGGE